jgi:hypothetical protein
MFISKLSITLIYNHNWGGDQEMSPNEGTSLQLYNTEIWYKML